MIHVRHAPELGSTVVEFSGALDSRGAEEIASVVLQQPSTKHLVIDLTRASNVYDSALGRLVDALPPRSHTIRGLGQRHARLIAFRGHNVDPRDTESRHTG